jgi:hypothetical protein
MPVLNTTMKPAHVKRLVEMLKQGNNSGGHAGEGCTSKLEPGSRKKEWSNLARRYLHMIGKRMGLAKLDKYNYRDGVPESRFHVSFNPGGPAVAGDVYLDTARLHVSISGDPYHHLGIVYQDFCGYNRWMPVEKLLDIEYVVKEFKLVHRNED